MFKFSWINHPAEPYSSLACPSPILADEAGKAASSARRMVASRNFKQCLVILLSSQFLCWAVLTAVSSKKRHKNDIISSERVQFRFDFYNFDTERNFFTIKVKISIYIFLCLDRLNSHFTAKYTYFIKVKCVTCEINFFIKHYIMDLHLIFFYLPSFNYNN